MQANQDIDLLIEPEWIIPVVPAKLTLTEHALAVHAGRIVALLPAHEAHTRYQPAQHYRLPGQVLIPGLVNLHTHAAMALLRGFADDMPLMDWLTQRIWPAEKALVSPAFVFDGTWLACLEMLRGGITCFSDMYFYPDAAAHAAQAAGIRAMLGITVLDFPSAYASDAQDYLNKGLAVRDTWLETPLLHFCMAPHAPYTVSDSTLKHVGTLAANLNLPVHIHLAETQEEIVQSNKIHGVRPLERLHRADLLDHRLIAVHGVHLDALEIALLAQQGCHLAHCPTSNMKLASGIAPLRACLDSGMNVGLGTDSAASNNRLDMFQEMRHAALLAKVANADAATVDAHQALHMATLGGASALGLDTEIGSLEVGKSADLCVVDLTDPIAQPCFDPCAHLVYCVGREAVSHVWVGGALQISNKLPVCAPPAQLPEQVRLWHDRLRSLVQSSSSP